MDLEFKKQICAEFLESYSIQIKQNLRIILEKLSKNKIDVSFLVLFYSFILILQYLTGRKYFSPKVMKSLEQVLDAQKSKISMISDFNNLEVELILFFRLKFLQELCCRYCESEIMKKGDNLISYTLDEIKSFIPLTNVAISSEYFMN